MKIRKLKPSDRPRIKKILSDTNVFDPHEIKVAMSLVDIFLKNKRQKEFLIHVAEEDGDTIGYVCFGPTPVTEGTYDLYWIAVNPGHHGKGTGRTLLSFAEDTVRKKQGRMMIIETSALPKYEKTRAFYLKNGYRLEAEIKDYYKPGDHRRIYTKNLNNNISKGV